MIVASHKLWIFLLMVHILDILLTNRPSLLSQ